MRVGPANNGLVEHPPIESGSITRTRQGRERRTLVSLLDLKGTRTLEIRDSSSPTDSSIAPRLKLGNIASCRQGEFICSER